jgi:hypothetical protein
MAPATGADRALRRGRQGACAAVESQDVHLAAVPAVPGQQRRESTIMTAVLPESSIIQGVRSLEVRWIFPGQLDQTVAEWFGRFPAVTESRQDIYLLNPDLRGLSVKVRAGRALEVKAYHGCPGILDVPGRARGHLQSRQKWSFPFRQPGHHSGQLVGWRPVDKRRRSCRFSLAGGQMVVAGISGLLQEEQSVKTPLTRQMDRLTGQILVIAGIALVTSMALNLARGEHALLTA